MSKFETFMAILILLLIVAIQTNLLLQIARMNLNNI